MFCLDLKAMYIYGNLIVNRYCIYVYPHILRQGKFIRCGSTIVLTMDIIAGKVPKVVSVSALCSKCVRSYG